ncbi:hypothetical protein WMF04_17200 [Sorangium sp. So ce260]|uniref:hypothetical protein n=1 Tax=Sorangium sp. So ce260 TaxID=3133291 RepID=UPI003F640B58
MSISRFFRIAILVTLAAAGCEVSDGGNCDPCVSDADCDPDKTCSEFRGAFGDSDYFCADAATSECTVTTYY